MIDINGLQINLIATVVATIAYFIVGFAWYAGIFAKPWIKEMNYNQNMRPGKKAMTKGITLMFLGSFLFCWVLSFYFAGWRLLPGSPGESGTVPFAINSALSVFIGFFIPVNLSRVVWEKHSFRLFAINSGYHLTSTIIAALIISFWI